MTPRDRAAARLVAIALLTLIGAASSSHAAALYTLTDLGQVKGTNYSFNSSGQVAIGDGLGRSQDGQYYIQTMQDPQLGPYRAFLGITGQQPTALNVILNPNANGDDFAFAVNKSGTVVGVEQLTSAALLGLPFLYTQSGGAQVVPTPYPSSNIYDSTAAAYSINDAGLIVGTANGGPGEYGSTAFLSDGKTSWDLNTLLVPGSGLMLTSATDINDDGQILAVAVDSQYRNHNVLLTPNPTPAPEPASWLMVASGVLALGLRRLVGRPRPGPSALASSKE